MERQRLHDPTIAILRQNTPHNPDGFESPVHVRQGKQNGAHFTFDIELMCVVL